MSKLVTSMSQPVAPIIVFYTHPQGYKMCLSLHKPYQGGCKAYNGGRSITVHFCIIKGEFDDSLVWPFETVVTITLLNNHKDDSHDERAYSFTANRYFHDQTSDRHFSSWCQGVQPAYQFKCKDDFAKKANCKQKIPYTQGHNQCNPVESTDFEFVFIIIIKTNSYCQRQIYILKSPFD